MKKILLLVSLMVLCLSVCQAQPFYFQRMYSYENNNLYFRDIVNSGNSDYILTGYFNISNPPRDAFYLLKINSCGYPIWNKPIVNSNSSTIPYSIVKKNYKFIILGGADSLFTLAIDSSSNQIWLKKYPIFGYNFLNLINTYDNGFAACGTSGQKGIVIKLDSNGNLEWTKIYTAGFNEFFKKIISTKNNYYLVGHKEDNKQQFSTPIIMKLDLNGDSLKSKSFSFTQSSIVPRDFILQNGVFTIFNVSSNVSTNTTRSFIIKCDENFKILDTLSVVVPTFNEYVDNLQRIIYLNPNKYIFESIFTSMGNSDYQYKILDSNFTVQSFRNLNTSITNDITLEGLYLAADNSIFSIGSYRTNFDRSANHFGYINKMDTLLNISEGIMDIKNKNQLINNFILDQNYPNPFNPSTKISYSLKKSSAIELKLFDINGRMIKIIESAFKPAGSYEINFSAEGLSSGVYFFSLYSEGILMDTKKAVVMK